MKAGKLEKIQMLRGFLALYIFTGHFFLDRINLKSSGLGFFLRFGQEAVILFFIISGFVIYYSTSKHGLIKFWPYFIRRLKTIYPVYIIALYISFKLVYLTDPEQALSNISLIQLLGNLVMLQDLSGLKPGTWIAPLGGNLPLWVLSYFWWSYMLYFPIHTYAKKRYHVHIAGSISIAGFFSFIAYHNQISLILLYFIIWWSGVELAKSFLDHSISFANLKQIIVYISIVVALVFTVVVNAAANNQDLSAGTYPVLILRHFLSCLSFIVLSIIWNSAGWVGFNFLFKPFLLFAPIAYSLYAVHYPLAVSSSFLKSIQIIPLELAGYVTITFATALLMISLNKFREVFVRLFKKL